LSGLHEEEEEDFEKVLLHAYAYMINVVKIYYVYNEEEALTM